MKLERTRFGGFSRPVKRQVELDRGQEGQLSGIRGKVDAPQLEEGERLVVTIGVADLEKDSAAVAAIYSQDDIIIHLAGVAPSMLDEKKYQDLRNEYGTLIAATADGVKGYYGRHQDEILYVAKTKDGKVVGAVTSQPEGVGVTIVNVGRLVVDRDHRRLGVARKLVEKVRDEAFGNPQITQIGAAILHDVDKSGVAFLFFSDLGFKLTGQVEQTCISWNPETDSFQNRGSWRIALHRNPNGISKNSM